MDMKTKDLHLGPIRQQDIPALAALFLDETVKQTYMVPDFPDEAAAEALAGRIMTLSQDPGRYVAGIFLDNQCIGLLNETERQDTAIELGYALLPAFHNRGYCTQALGGAIDYLLSRGFSQVLTGAFETNTPSIRVMEKCGMKRLEKEDLIAYRGKTHRCLYYHAVKE
jgi:RimJ/RimL family protein N-acetyltransferase